MMRKSPALTVATAFTLAAAPQIGGGLSGTRYAPGQRVQERPLRATHAPTPPPAPIPPATPQEIKEEKKATKAPPAYSTLLSNSKQPYHRETSPSTERDGVRTRVWNRIGFPPEDATLDEGEYIIDEEVAETYERYADREFTQLGSVTISAHPFGQELKRKHRARWDSGVQVIYERLKKLGITLREVSIQSTNTQSKSSRKIFFHIPVELMGNFLDEEEREVQMFEDLGCFDVEFFTAEINKTLRDAIQGLIVPKEVEKKRRAKPKPAYQGRSTDSSDAIYAKLQREKEANNQANRRLLKRSQDPREAKYRKFSDSLHNKLLRKASFAERAEAVRVQHEQQRGYNTMPLLEAVLNAEHMRKNHETESFSHLHRRRRAIRRESLRHMATCFDEGAGPNHEAQIPLIELEKRTEYEASEIEEFLDAIPSNEDWEEMRAELFSFELAHPNSPWDYVHFDGQLRDEKEKDFMRWWGVGELQDVMQHHTDVKEEKDETGITYTLEGGSRYPTVFNWFKFSIVRHVPSSEELGYAEKILFTCNSNEFSGYTTEVLISQDGSSKIAIPKLGLSSGRALNVLEDYQYWTEKVGAICRSTEVQRAVAKGQKQAEQSGLPLPAISARRGQWLGTDASPPLSQS